jgi:predicted ferric reductase
MYKGGSSLFLLLLLCNPFLRSFSYEIFIRIHQALAIVSAYSIWRHLESKPLIPRIPAYIFAAAFLLTLLLQGFFIHRSQARIAHFEDTIKVELTLSRPLKVKAGQYINLWIPSLSFWSIFQSHPFIVASWSDGEQNSLDLFIEPRRGITQKLLHHLIPGTDGSQPRLDGSLPRLALFSGPHGISAPVGDYETVLMVTSGSGIVAQLPYLKQLIYGYNARKSRTRRVHLVWQLETRGKVPIVSR